MHPAYLTIDKLVQACEIKTTRRGGPGGQHRNKVETAVVVQHLPTGICAEANERRSQSANLAIAIHRLRLKLAVQVRSISSLNSPLDGQEKEFVSTIAPSPTELWQGRLQQGRFKVAVVHSDFPALLAELLDHLQLAGWELQHAAPALTTTASQLAKLLREHPPAMMMVNQQRAALGLHALR